MKFRNKLQFLSLLLAAVICGQELVHVLFHSQSDCLPCHYQQQSTGKSKLKSPVHDHQIPSTHTKAICPLCSSLGGKSILEINIEPLIVGHDAVIHQYLNEPFTVNSFSPNFSRGPPAA